MFIPEIYINSFLKIFQNEIYQSVQADVTPGKTNNLIAKMFGDDLYQLGDFDYKREAFSMFAKNYPWPFTVGFTLQAPEFNQTSVQLHLLLPDETYERGSIGEVGDVEQDSVTGDFAINNEIFNTERYILLIVSANSDTVVLVHRILAYMFLRYIYYLNGNGFDNFKLSANDMSQLAQLVPQTMYARSLVFEFTNQFTALDINAAPMYPIKLTANMEAKP